MKKVKLSDEDRCAIDLVLQQRAVPPPPAESRFGKPSASLRKRVKNVGQLFDLLESMAAVEPKPNLVSRTLRYIRRHEHEPAPLVHPGPTRRPVAVSHPTGGHRSLH